MKRISSIIAADFEHHLDKELINSISWRTNASPLLVFAAAWTISLPRSSFVTSSWLGTSLKIPSWHALSYFSPTRAKSSTDARP